MGKVISYLKRPFINYAVEAKTERLMKRLETEKPKSHPLYPTEQRVLDGLRHDHPELRDRIKAKSEKLDDFLKQVKVQSHDPLVDPGHVSRRADPKHLPVAVRSLDNLGVSPEHRDDVKFPDDYGIADPPPDRIPPGKISFRQTVQLLQMMSAEKADQKSIENFAWENFRFEPKKTRLLFKYFKPFAVSAEYERVRRITDAERADQGPTFAEYKSEMETLRLKASLEMAESKKRMDSVRRHSKKPVAITGAEPKPSENPEPNPDLEPSKTVDPEPEKTSKTGRKQDVLQGVSSKQKQEPRKSPYPEPRKNPRSEPGRKLDPEPEPKPSTLGWKPKWEPKRTAEKKTESAVREPVPELKKLTDEELKRKNTR